MICPVVSIKDQGICYVLLNHLLLKTELGNQPQQLWELWETRSALGGAFSKPWGSLWENGFGFFHRLAQGGSFHS